VTDRYSVSMTSQHTDISDLSVVTDQAPQVWFSGTENEGLDARLEIAYLDARTRVAVRDSRHPTGPALIFTAEDWNALLGVQTDLVDLR
jgi:uncharacterized protein DUF397